MSWQSYIDNLCQYPQVNSGVIGNSDGAYAQSAGFNVTPAEMRKIADVIAGRLPGDGSFTLSGKKYMMLRKDEKCVDMKIGATFATAYLSDRATIVVAVHTAAEGEASDQSVGGKVNDAAFKVCDYLNRQGC